ncbi:hypothetical protein PtB15_8B25 [Puccinia triticina]|nr:hypothetical protein PtB15_8B25 [Puccinia triticina]
MVFDARIFGFFSKLPIHYCDNENMEDGEDEENQPADLLTPEEEVLYRPLYEDLVNHEKVALVADKPPELGTKDKKNALKHVMRINAEVIANLLFWNTWLRY